MSKKENTKKEKVEEVENIQEVNEPQKMQEPDYKDLYLRTLADMDNLRRNTNKRISEIYQSANEKLIVEMLPYLDALDLAVEHNANNDNGYVVLRKQLIDILTRFGVKEIEINQDDQFDSDKMNAIRTMTSSSLAQQGLVAYIGKKGYMLNDKVIRYADVIVWDSAA